MATRLSLPLCAMLMLGGALLAGCAGLTFEERPVLRAGSGMSTPLVHNDTVYVSTNDGNFYALELPSGAVRWRVPIGDSASALIAPYEKSAPVLDGTTAYVRSMGGHITAVDTNARVVRWAFQRPDATMTLPTIGAGVVYSGATDGRLYALDPQRGAELWHFDAGGPIHAQPILAGDALYVLAEGKGLYALDLATRQPRWTVPLSINQLTEMSAASTGLYVANKGDALYALDLATGKLRWRKPLDIFTKPVVAGDTVYLGGALTEESEDPDKLRRIEESDGFKIIPFYLFGIDAQTGQTHWKTEISGKPMIPVVAGERIYTSTTMHLYVHSASDGSLVHTFEKPRSPGSPPALDDRRVYVSSFSDLYILDQP